MARKKLSLFFLTSCFWTIVIGYFKKHQPSKRIIFSHTYIMLAVTLQLILAPFVEFTPNGEVSPIWYHFLATWLHMLNGLGLLCMTLFFCYEVLRRKGLEWMFPYMYGNFSAMGKDVKAILQLRLSFKEIRKADKETRPFMILEQMKLPRPHPSGLGAAVQGFGLATQFTLVILGFFFFITWIENLDIAWTIIAAHRIIAVPFFLFYFGHGGMGLLHIFNHHAQQRMQKVRADTSGQTTGTESCDLPK